MSVRVHVSRHSGADVDLNITGAVDPLVGEISEVILDPKDFAECVTVRVMNIFRAVQNGVEAWLEWEGSGDLIIPLEGYGNTDLSKFNGLVNPRSEGWTGGIRLRVRGHKQDIGLFTISLELSKMRS